MDFIYLLRNDPEMSEEFCFLNKRFTFSGNISILLVKNERIHSYFGSLDKNVDFF